MKLFDDETHGCVLMVGTLMLLLFLFVMIMVLLFGMFAGFIWLICWCFNLVFDIKIVFGIFLILCFAIGLFSKKEA